MSQRSVEVHFDAGGPVSEAGGGTDCDGSKTQIAAGVWPRRGGGRAGIGGRQRWGRHRWHRHRQSSLTVARVRPMGPPTCGMRKGMGRRRGGALTRSRLRLFEKTMMLVPFTLLIIAGTGAYQQQLR